MGIPCHRKNFRCVLVMFSTCPEMTDFRSAGYWQRKAAEVMTSTWVSCLTFLSELQNKGGNYLIDSLPSFPFLSLSVFSKESEKWCSCQYENQTPSKLCSACLMLKDTGVVVHECPVQSSLCHLCHKMNVMRKFFFFIWRLTVKAVKLEHTLCQPI